MKNKASQDSGTLRRIMWCLIVVAIGYGSLYPFHYTADFVPADPMWALLMQRPVWTNFPDVIGNILLFVPLGLICAGPHKARVILACVFAVLYAYAIQVVQFWFPDRSPSLADALWNILGLALGVLGAGLVARVIHGVALGEVRSKPWLQGALLVLALWLGSETAPFVPTLDVGHIKDALRPLRVFDPELVRILAIAAGLAVCAECLRLSFGEKGQRWRFFALIALWLLGKLFVSTHAVRWSSLVAIPAGFVLMLCTQRLKDDARCLWLAGLVWLGYSASALFPLELRLTPVAMNWVPFAARLSGNMLTNLDSLFLALFNFSAILWLLVRQGARLPGMTVLLACWVGAMEAAQTWLEGRTPDATEVLLVFVAALLIARLGAPVTATVQSASR